ncbi:MAG: lycopene cyclase family protein [Bacteroidota bacterium]
MEKYDYIIAGLGAAGLSLAFFMMKFMDLRQQKVLLIDNDNKNKNDRTWTFWGEAPEEFSHLVEKTWYNLGLYDKKDKVEFSVTKSPYHYIPAIRFYNYIIPKLKQIENFTFLKGHVEQITDQNNEPTITVDAKTYKADYIFNSAFQDITTLAQVKNEIALQQFKGWELEFDYDILNDKKVTLMDFSISETNKVNFIYVLPITKKRMIINFTAFGSEKINNGNAEECIAEYLKNNYSQHYKITRKEQGIIPMSHVEFERYYSPGIMNVGIFGGDARPSTGYTFINTINNSRKIAYALAKEKKPPVLSNNKRHYNFYDRIFIRVLKDNPSDLKKALLALFKNNKSSQAFKFLSSKTSILHEIPIVLSLPIIPFINGLLKELKNL